MYGARNTGLREVEGKFVLFLEYLGKFPAIFISLKDVDGLRFEDARKHLIKKVGTEADRYLLDSDRLSVNEKEKYSALVALIQGFFGQALKTNEFLQFAILTGCLRVSKESIFTGLFVEFDQGEGHSCAGEDERKLLLRHAAGTAAESGKLADPVQCGDWRGLQRYICRDTCTYRNCDRAGIRKRRKPGSGLLRSVKAD